MAKSKAAKDSKHRAQVYKTTNQAESFKHTQVKSSKYCISTKTTSRLVEQDQPEPSQRGEGNEVYDEYFGLGAMPGGWESDMCIRDAGESVKKKPRPAEPGRIMVKTKEPAKRYSDSDSPLATWKEKHRDEYLDWNMVTEGRGRLYYERPICSNCRALQADFRCRDCFALRMVCRGCMVNKHTDVPLHRPEVWKKDFFQAVTLRELGLRVYLGHGPGVRCPYPHSQNDFTVLDWSGIHSVDIDFCGCEGAPDRHLQLMEIGWWPGSYKEPRTAASFQLLRNFHIVNLQSQTAPTDFYRSLEQITDGSRLSKLPDREQQWMWILREFRNVKMAKRCGRGHDPSGMAGTAYGEATVPCRACPDPERNLPVGWDKVPAEDQYLYGLFLSQDANFKQKARSRPNDCRDPPLGPGWGCFVPNDIYMKEVAKRTNQQEISHCAGFKAITHANTKKSKGLRATGIGAVSCARHGTFRPNGMGDLQIGERYSNMDFIALFSIIGLHLLSLFFFSYDIACQWAINFWTRMAEFPEDMHIPSTARVIFKVPKFHLVAHGIRCLAKFAFCYTEGAAKVDGEAPERIWSWLNGSARSFSMMAAGGRWDTMDDFANYWNWQKAMTLDVSLKKKMVKAVPEAVVNARAYAAFTDALKDEHSTELRTWQDQVVKWEQGDPDAICPYEVSDKVITLNRVKKEVAEEEYQREKAGENNACASLSAVVIEGVDIEESQRSLFAAAESKKRTDLQERSINTRRTNLLQRIRRFRDSQLILMPGLRRFIEAEPASECARPETMKLFLPSSLDAHSRKVICLPEVLELEARLRYAQAHESLGQLRSQLRARSVAYRHTSRLAPSQGMFTKMNHLQHKLETRIKAITATYRGARSALLELRGEGDWMNELKELKDEDIRGISERVLAQAEKEDFRVAQERAGVSKDAINDVLEDRNTPTVTFNPVLTLGQSKHTLSWIWYTHSSVIGTAQGSGSSFDELQDSLRSEWCKARANARRSREEVRLVDEEMRRAIEYCYYLAGWWEKQIGRRVGLALFLEEGFTAYAKEHAHVERERGLGWSSAWSGVRVHSRKVLEYLLSAKHGELPEGIPELEVELEMDDDEKGDEFDDEDDD